MERKIADEVIVAHITHGHIIFDLLNIYALTEKLIPDDMLLLLRRPPADELL